MHSITTQIDRTWSSIGKTLARLAPSPSVRCYCCANMQRRMKTYVIGLDGHGCSNLNLTAAHNESESNCSSQQREVLCLRSSQKRRSKQRRCILKPSRFLLAPRSSAAHRAHASSLAPEEGAQSMFFKSFRETGLGARWRLGESRFLFVV